MSSSDEVLGVFQSLYSRLNSRETSSLQKHELLLFSSGDAFDAFATEIFYEIWGLENGDYYDSRLPSGGNLPLTSAEVWNALEARGYLNLEQNFQKKQFVPIMYSMLTDLQCSRLSTSKKLNDHLRIPTFEDRVINEIANDMLAVATKLGIRETSVDGETEYNLYKFGCRKSGESF